MTFTAKNITLLDDVVRGLADYDDLPEILQHDLMEHFMPHMPYGTAKATTGDPIEFIIYHLPSIIQKDAEGRFVPSIAIMRRSGRPVDSSQSGREARGGK